jgi:putative MATE family efflux protein
MIGSLGEVSIAAVGLGNQVFFVMMLTVFGVGGGLSIFVAQYWGTEDIKNIKKAMGIGLLLASAVALFFALVAFIVPQWVLGIYSKDTAVVSEGVEYLRIAVLSYLPFAITSIYVAGLRNVGEVKLPLVASSIALVLNTIINYTLIYGHFGFIAMGVKGAAIATVIARSVEMLLLLVIIYQKKYVVNATLKELFAFNAKFFKNFINKASFVIFNELMWGTGTSVYFMIYGRMGTNELAAMNIGSVVFNILHVFAMGVGSACAIMIGNALGASEFVEAKAYAKKSLYISLVSGVIIGGAVSFFVPHIMNLYSVTDVVKQQTSQVMYTMTALLPLICVQFTLFIGILRPGGETKFCALVDIFSLWCVGLPAAAVGALLFHLSLPWVYVLTKLETVVCGIMCYKRYRSNKWVNNIVNEGSED